MTDNVLQESQEETEVLEGTLEVVGVNVKRFEHFSQLADFTESFLVLNKIPFKIEIEEPFLYRLTYGTNNRY